MIKNQRQYKLTQTNSAMFADALARLAREECPSDTDPLIFKAQFEGMESQLQTLQRELKEYEALREGKVESLSLNGLEELPLGLIKARIARGLTQKNLAELVGVKSQQIQRWEHEDYENVGFQNLVEIAHALRLNISEHIELPAKPKSALVELKRLGIDRAFIQARLASNDAKYRLGNLSDADLLGAAAGRLHRIYGMRVAANGVVVSDNRLQMVGAGGRFKIPQHADKAKVSAYAVYAHHLANIVSKAAAHLPVRPVPNTWQALRESLCGTALPTFESLLRGAWALGLPVLPLSDPIHFHGVCWRFEGRNVIVLKQTSQYSSRWAFDLLHEIHHAGEAPESDALSCLQMDATDAARRESDDEQKANLLAGNVLLNGRAEDLYQNVLSLSKGRVERIKNSVQTVAASEEVNKADLANYVAYRLNKERFVSWWGAAANLQPDDENPLDVARRVFLEHINLHELDKDECDLLRQSLQDPCFS